MLALKAVMLDATQATQTTQAAQDNISRTCEPELCFSCLFSRYRLSSNMALNEWQCACLPITTITITHLPVLLLNNTTLRYSHHLHFVKPHLPPTHYNPLASPQRRCRLRILLLPTCHNQYPSTMKKALSSSCLLHLTLLHPSLLLHPSSL